MMFYTELMHESWKSGLEFKIQLLLLSFHPKKEKLRRFKGHCIKGWGEGEFSYSRFFAVGLFRLVELENATEPIILDKANQFI